MEGHAGFVSALSISCSGMMYSGDSLGMILEWTGSKVKSKKQCYQWKFSRCLNLAFYDSVFWNLNPAGTQTSPKLGSAIVLYSCIASGRMMYLNWKLWNFVMYTACGALLSSVTVSWTCRNGRRRNVHNFVGETFLIKSHRKSRRWEDNVKVKLGKVLLRMGYCSQWLALVLVILKIWRLLTEN